MQKGLKLLAWFVCLAGLGLNSSSRGSVPPTDEEPHCTAPCVALPTSGATGSLPAGVFLNVACDPASSGNGVDPGCATCVPCKMRCVVSFNGYGGAYCVSVDSGAGWNTPTGIYARPGWLVTNCNASPSFFSVLVLLCGSTPPNGVYQVDHVLDCPCSY